MDLNLIIVAVISLGGPLFLYLQNKQNARRLAANDANVIAIEKEKLDGMVMDRSKALYDGMIQHLESQVAKLRSTVEFLEKSLDDEREDNGKLRNRIRELEEEIDTLEEEISFLKRQSLS